MNALTNFLQFFTLLLALMAGASLAKQGVISARATMQAGSFAARVLGWTVAVDVLQFRPDKVYYRLAILPVSS